MPLTIKAFVLIKDQYKERHTIQIVYNIEQRTNRIRDSVLKKQKYKRSIQMIYRVPYDKIRISILVTSYYSVLRLGSQ